VDETSMHAVIEALFEIAPTRTWTGDNGPANHKLGQALELTMNIADRRMKGNPMFIFSLIARLRAMNPQDQRNAIAILLTGSSALIATISLLQSLH
jgi:hypothetical protein